MCAICTDRNAGAIDNEELQADLHCEKGAKYCNCPMVIVISQPYC